MKEASLSSVCTTVQVDTSFNFDSSKYKVCAFCYLNPTTNCSEISALAFLSEETAVNFGRAFCCFEHMCSEPPTIFMVDKDFNEISILREVFPTATNLLCLFHVIKYIKNLVATALTTVESKNDIMTNFKPMMYARTEESYKQKKSSFLASVSTVEVRASQKYVSQEQFLRNWDAREDTWAAYYRKGLPTLGDNTNNRVEWSFWTLKQSIRDHFPTLPVIQQSVIHLVRFREGRITRASKEASLKSLAIYDSDARISTLNRNAALVLRPFLQKFESTSRTPRSYEYRRWLRTGNVWQRSNNLQFFIVRVYFCTFHSNHQAPCRHILLMRKYETGFLLSVLCASLIHVRDHRNNSTRSCTRDLTVMPMTPEISLEDVVSNDRRTTHTLNNREKYNLMLSVVMEIASLASCNGTEQFTAYLSAIKKVARIVRTGSDIELVTEGGKSKRKLRGSCHPTPLMRVHSKASLPIYNSARSWRPVAGPNALCDNCAHSIELAPTKKLSLQLEEERNDHMERRWTQTTRDNVLQSVPFVPCK